MTLIKTIHYANSISEFYLNKDKNSITELKYLPDGRIKEYNVKDSCQNGRARHGFGVLVYLTLIVFAST